LDKLNTIVAGLIAGLIGPWIGALAFYLVMFNHKPLLTFIDVIQGSNSAQSSLISVSLIFNLAFFFLALNKDWYQAARGVIFGVFVYAPFVIYFKYVA
jgi:hypothetical protein